MSGSMSNADTGGSLMKQNQLRIVVPYYLEDDDGGVCVVDENLGNNSDVYGDEDSGGSPSSENNDSLGGVFFCGDENWGAFLVGEDWEEAGKREDRGQNKERGSVSRRHKLGGYENIGFRKKDMYNKIGEQRRTLCFDAKGAIEYLGLLGLNDRIMYYEHIVDEHAAIITNETEETYVWLLEQFSKCMKVSKRLLPYQNTMLSERDYLRIGGNAGLTVGIVQDVEASAEMVGMAFRGTLYVQQQKAAVCINIFRH
ncbi:FAR1-related protein [Sesbania bispinosa]|nr:FAR1-related protein [Sesbania bispinosa]